MPDHRGDAGIAVQRRAQHAEAISAACCGARPAAALRRRAAAASSAASGSDSRERQLAVLGSGPFRKKLEQTECDAGEQDLRIDEPRAQIEQAARLAIGDPPRQRKGAANSLKIRAFEPSVAQRIDAVDKRQTFGIAARHAAHVVVRVASRSRCVPRQNSWAPGAWLRA